MKMLISKEILTNTFPYSGRLNEKIDAEIGLMVTEARVELKRQIVYRFIKTGNKKLDKKKTIKKKELLNYLTLEVKEKGGV